MPQTLEIHRKMRDSVTLMYSFYVVDCAKEADEIPHRKEFSDPEDCWREGLRVAKILARKGLLQNPVCIEIIQDGTFAVPRYVNLSSTGAGRPENPAPIAPRGPPGRPRTLPELQPPATDPITMAQYAKQMGTRATPYFRALAGAYLFDLEFRFCKVHQHWTRTPSLGLNYALPSSQFAFSTFLAFNDIPFDISKNKEDQLRKWLNSKGFSYHPKEHAWVENKA